jgi:hypothetical protein
LKILNILMVSYPRLGGIFPLIQGEQVSDGDGGRAPVGPLKALEGVDHDVPCARDVEERQQESETQLPRAKLSDHLGHDVVLLLLLGGLFFRPVRVGRHCAQQGNALCKSQFAPITHTLSFSSHRCQAAHPLPQRGPRTHTAHN